MTAMITAKIIVRIIVRYKYSILLVNISDTARNC